MKIKVNRWYIEVNMDYPNDSSNKVFISGTTEKNRFIGVLPGGASLAYTSAGNCIANRYYRLIKEAYEN